ncbi:hypothetical protein Xen7305DRAFT_00002210 [Xenococcus sp. PCC 7305]|uniref:hypothetical protein n=1 Tax=Xenococcus sp. PCC 7305 TaxID=102125 RepID=UPI0002AC93D9|nr:hypothetical protein [Xenococcus sp. PCC 7305]ELS00520.1 hypothetical protein Xen7305DRAFT_00002210 [Xenococcus sp. PCC 7305]
MIESNDDKESQLNKSGINPRTNSWAAVGNEDAIVFSILLSGKDKSDFSRLSAMVAYAQYSLHKHQFIEKYTRDEGVAPSDEQIKTIIRSFQDENSDMVENLGKQSEKSLNEILEEYVSQISQENFVKPIEKIVKDNTKFCVSVCAGIVATFIYSVLVAIVIFTVTPAFPNTKLSRIIQILLEKPEDSTEINELSR